MCVYSYHTAKLRIYICGYTALLLNSNNNSARMHIWCVLVHVSAGRLHASQMFQIYSPSAYIAYMLNCNVPAVYIYTVQVNYILLYYYDLYYEYVYIA